MRTKKVILLVDNDEQGLSVLKFMLKTNFYYVIATTDPHDAVNLFNDSSINLVIADVEMRGMNGMELAEILKRLDSSVPIILLGNPPESFKELHPADALLNKAIPPAELLECVKNMTARKRGPKKRMQKQAPPVQRAAATQSV